MTYKLTEEDILWLESAIEKDLTYLQVKQKLETAGYEKAKLKSFLKYYKTEKDEMEAVKERDEKIEKEKNPQEEIKEGEFKEITKQYFKDEKQLSFWERREVRGWLKKLKVYEEILKKLIEGLKKDMVVIEEKYKGDNKEIEEQIEHLKIEIIDRLWDGKDLFTIEHPYNHNIINDKRELMDVKFDDLIKILKQNEEELRLVVNGKI